MILAHFALSVSDGEHDKKTIWSELGSDGNSWCVFGWNRDLISIDISL